MELTWLPTAIYLYASRQTTALPTSFGQYAPEVPTLPVLFAAVLSMDRPLQGNE